ncbi:MAG: amidohydrolase [Rhizobiales bacterium]|nr:amidohydrolase [Hyphomicrobiales bacterium]
MAEKSRGGVNRREALGAATGAAAIGLATPSAVLAQAAPSVQSAGAPPAPPTSSAVAARAVNEVRDPILRISRETWALAELSLAEVKSAEVHVRELEAQGFRIVSRGTAGVPTAFMAEWKQGNGGPVIGYLPEYDALPGLGNAAEPRETPGPTGKASGHGCGHNTIGAGCTGAAFALKKMMEAQRTPGTIRVYGCAAEETEGAKVYMARENLFADCDAVLAFHPAPFAGAGTVRMNATNNAKIIFRGTTAHAGNSPWEGRSALKAAEMFGMGIQMMREHILPTARIHYIYEAAGVAPNVTPDFAQIWITIRDIDRDKVNGMTDWIRQIADGAAMATQTKAEFDLFFGMYDLLPNEPLAQHLYRHIAAVPLEWTTEEQNFAKACQKAFNVPEVGMATKALPFLKDISAGGSTDIGDISYQVPAGVFAWPTLPLGIGLHTWPVTACGGMSIGDKGSLNTARILAAAGFDLMTDPTLRASVKADFVKRRGVKPFQSPLPPTRKAPLTLPSFLVKGGQDDVFSGVKSET